MTRAMRITAVGVLLCSAAWALPYHIDQPVPVTLAHGEYCLGARLWGEGGVLLRLGVGLFDRITLGASYGGDKLLGAKEPELYPRPEIFARGVILTERGYFPDLAVGFESQGYGHIADGEYEVYPKGVYLCLGKTITPSNTYLELAGNYWRGPSGFVVVNQAVSGGFEVMLEYDLALTDDRPELKHRGYLNFGTGWTFSEQLRLVIGLRDILGNRPESQLNRVLDLSFRSRF